MSTASKGFVAYEARLRSDREWAMNEGDRHFRGQDQVFQALRKLVHRLDQIGVPYAIAGALAMNAHGFRRLTVDVDVLVTREGLEVIHEKLDGLGYVRPFAASKNLRDAEYGVRVDFLLAGDYPGDGLPKPVSFPDPGTVAINLDGIHYLKLPTLIELKLASGMTNPGRLKDLADVQELIKILALPADLSQQLDLSVRDQYSDLWIGARSEPLEP